MTAMIGCVPYLNARPLIHRLADEIVFHEPSRLADRMHRRELVVGLVPVAEVLAHDQYDILDGMAIASRGPVRSVFLAHHGPVEAIQRVAVTTASRTSAWLVRVILKYRYDRSPEFVPRPAGGDPDPTTAEVLIGDEAIRYAMGNGAEFVLDLGEAWAALTGLPFVYAVWAAQRGQTPPGLVARLRAAKRIGLAQREQIVQDSTEATAEFRREYLTQHVCYDLGAEEKQGLRRFQQYLLEMGLVKHDHDLRYIV